MRSAALAISRQVSAAIRHRSYPPLWHALEESVWRPGRVDPRPRGLPSRSFSSSSVREREASERRVPIRGLPRQHIWQARIKALSCSLRLSLGTRISRQGSRRGVGIPLVIRRTESLNTRCRVSLLIEPPNGDPSFRAFIHLQTSEKA